MEELVHSIDQDIADKKQDAKGTVEGGGNTNSRVEGQNRVRLGQKMGEGKNWGQEKMHGVDKMDTERNSQEGKLQNSEEEGIGWG